MFWALLHQDIDFYDKDENSVGILTSRLASEAQDIQGASGLTLGSIIQVLITLIGGFVIGLAYGWKLTLVAMISIPVLIIAGYCRMRLLASFAEKSRAAYAKSSRIATEAVAAIKTVQYLTRENDVHQKYIHLLEEPLRDGLRSAWTTTPIFAFSQSANFIVNSLVFYYGGRLIAYEGYTVQQFFTVFVAIVFGAMGIGRIFAFAPDISKAFVSGDSVLQLLETKPHIDPRSEDGKKVKETKGEFSFKGIHFNYPTRPHFKVLQGLDLEIKQGQFIAFVGPSGCGKSTTIGLIERFYNQSKGRVYLDSIPIDELNLSSYRSQIGLVSQEPNLFDMTVKENVTLGCPNLPSPEAIESACKDANIHSFIKSLPQGYDTKLGGKGGQLSGGQKQRIAIARALVRNPRILLLDEATSALDAESEKVVQEALDQAAKGRTTIAIAHRLSSIQNADVIYVLKNGRVTEKGSHQELVELKGVYYELVQQQNLERT